MDLTVDLRMFPPAKGIVAPDSPAPKRITCSLTGATSATGSEVVDYIYYIDPDQRSQRRARDAWRLTICATCGYGLNGRPLRRLT